MCQNGFDLLQFGDIRTTNHQSRRLFAFTLNKHQTEAIPIPDRETAGVIQNYTDDILILHLIAFAVHLKKEFTIAMKIKMICFCIRQVGANEIVVVVVITGEFSIRVSLDLDSLYTKMASHVISGLSSVIVQVRIRP